MQNLNNRNNIVKRKIPESFYAPPVLKTQVFSSELQRSHINHSHTNSLPVETVQYTTQSSINNLNSTGSFNNLTDQSNYSSFQQQQHVPVPQQLQQQQQPIAFPNQQVMNVINENNQSQHAKTYSLPVSFDNPPLINSNNNNNNQFANTHLQPPLKNSKNLIQGDIPLPEGYTCEVDKSTGQIYFINHITKTTQWNDPRQAYNLPINQTDINKELRTSIHNSIPLPANWEEARTATGEIYYIDHSNQTTSWSDPRISIYMQQENLKNSNQNINYLQNNNASSNSSLFSPFSSASSSSSSSSSLNINQNFSQHQSYDNYNSMFSTDGTQANYKVINNLKKKLDQLLSQKFSICKELEELSKQEISLKSKLNQRDLDEVLNMLKSNDISMKSFSQYEPINVASSLASLNQNETHKLNEKLNNSNLNSSNIDAELDSTLVVGVGDNSTLNTSIVAL